MFALKSIASHSLRTAKPFSTSTFPQPSRRTYRHHNVLPVPRLSADIRL